MAKFYMEDGTSKSGDAIMNEYMKKQVHDSIVEKGVAPCHFESTEIQKLKVPGDDKNFKRLGNISMGDLLKHIQEPLSLKNMCIIELITNNFCKCMNNSPEIDIRVKKFAEQFITFELKKEFPQHFKKDGCEFDETDDSYISRLCHIIMHRNYPHKYQMIKCEECIAKWMNSSKW